MQLRTKDVAHELARPHFLEVSFTLERGFTGLVGENGAGKSTLLGILAKKIVPTSGFVVLTPRELVVRLVEQETTAANEKMHALAEDESRGAIRLRAALDLDLEGLLRLPSTTARC